MCLYRVKFNFRQNWTRDRKLTWKKFELNFPRQNLLLYNFSSFNSIRLNYDSVFYSQILYASQIIEPALAISQDLSLAEEVVEFASVCQYASVSTCERWSLR